ncbi:hypothetical protein RJT34_16089 [Clitoria ternatea]|uniref:Uncharacterized protein n=1 Tax=Clitoria ternatea TaxID=43366 RepID=A0AAN9PCK8_CLITE
MALQRTLEFEDELAEKFGRGTQSREIRNEIEEIGRGTNSGSSASDIRKKYDKKLAVYQGGVSKEKDGSKDLAVPGAGVLA